ncbi:hypothetical protein TorRG33x02_218210 [Trema orientale]|uniref:Uncharacterized protein n=1 Tax=Trema orientale TaxID=63057 RepID=A0A2P5E9X5_TREOI|nr:hypothetical protein TorRG33x02_218210 [Trema orientale]
MATFPECDHRSSNPVQECSPRPYRPGRYHRTVKSPPPDGGVSHLNSSRATSGNDTRRWRTGHGLAGLGMGWQVGTLTFKTPKGATHVRTRDLLPPDNNDYY